MGHVTNPHLTPLHGKQTRHRFSCNYVDGILRNCFTPTETVVQQQQRQQPQQQRLFTAPPPPPPPRAPLVNYRIEPRIAAVPRQQVVVRQGPPKSVPRNTLARIINQVDYVQPTTVRSTQPVTRQQEDDEDVKAVPLDDVDAVKALVKKYRTRPNSV